jgi:hypothetical protein
LYVYLVYHEDGTLRADEILGFHQIVLLLIPGHSAEKILTQAAGFKKALSKLDQSKPDFPTSEDRKVIYSIAKHFSGQNHEAVNLATRYSLAWKDLDLFQIVLQEICDPFTEIGHDVMVQVWSVFGPGVCKPM